jgi:hypothetical protein
MEKHPQTGSKESKIRQRSVEKTVKFGHKSAFFGVKIDN